MAVFLEIWGLQAKGLVERGITHIMTPGIPYSRKMKPAIFSLMEKTTGSAYPMPIFRQAAVMWRKLRVARRWLTI